MNLFEVFDGHLSVDLGAVDATVAQHFLDMTHRSPSLQHVGGKGVTEAVEADGNFGIDHSAIAFADVLTDLLLGVGGAVAGEPEARLYFG